MSITANHTAFRNSRFLSTVFLFLASFVTPVFAAEPADDEATRAYFAANGMLQRGLNDLAATEYRKFLSAHPNHEKSGVARYGLAVALYRQGHLEEAAAELKPLSANTSFPFAVEVQLILGQCRLSQRKFEQAVESFDAVERLNAEHALADDAAAGAIEALYLTGNYAEVVKRCGTFAGRWKSGPFQERVAFYWGAAALGTGDFAACTEQLRPVADSKGESDLRAQAGLMLGQCWFRAGDEDKALAAFGRVKGLGEESQDDLAYWTAKCLIRKADFASAAAKLQQAQSQFPKSELSPLIAYDLSFAQLQVDDRNGAIRTLEAFLSEFGKHELASDALHLLAVANFKEGRYAPCRDQCAQFLAAYPKHRLTASMLFMQGESEYLAEQWTESVATYRKFLSGFPNDAQADAAKYRLGMALHKLGRADEAAPLLESASASKDESFRPALLLVGDMKFQRGEWKPAEDAFAQYLALDSTSATAAEALLKLGLCQQRQAQYLSAIESFDRLLKLKGAGQKLTGQARFEKAQALMALDKSAEAERVFKELAAEGGAPEFMPYVFNHLGNLSLRRKAYGQALEWFEKASQTASSNDIEADILLGRGQALLGEAKLPAAAEAFSMFAERFASDARARFAKAQQAIALARMDRHEDALRVISQVEKDKGTLDPSLVEALLYEKAWCLRQLNRPEAEAAFRAVASRADTAALKGSALLELADQEAKNKNYEKSLELLREFLALAQAQPEQVSKEGVEQALYRLAMVTFQLERFGEAAEQFEKFLAAYPSGPLTASASLFCGESWVKHSRPDRAVTWLSRFVEEFPKDASHGSALLRLGECQAALQRWAASETAYARFLQENSDNEFSYQAQFGVGWARENLGRFDEAIAAYREVVERHQGPTAARAQFQIGECLFAKQSYQDAASELLKVDILYAYPEWSAAALFEAGRCFEKLEKRSEAEAQYKAVVERFGQTRWAAMARDHLAGNNGHSQATK